MVSAIHFKRTTRIKRERLAVIHAPIMLSERLSYESVASHVAEDSHEMAQAAIAEARRHPGFNTIVAGVDEVNAASLRVLEKLGFQRVAAHPGSFGNTLILLLGQKNA
jgi:L-amino acid N-acyltransferase YncA